MDRSRGADWWLGALGDFIGGSRAATPDATSRPQRPCAILNHTTVGDIYAPWRFAMPTTPPSPRPPAPRRRVVSPPATRADLRILGPFQVVTEHGVAPVSADSLGAALLRYVAVRAPGAATRRALLAAFWPGRDPDLARQSLHAVVSDLHRRAGLPLLRYEGGAYILGGDPPVDVDAARFDALFQRGEYCRAAGNTLHMYALFARAELLYRGDLAEVRHDGDALAALQRERLRTTWLQVHYGLAEYFYAHRADQGCREYLDRMLAVDPCHEDAHRLLMRVFACRGERALALQQYHLCARRLRELHGAAPAPATVALYEQLRLEATAPVA